MEILCQLTDWQTKETTRGRGVGGSTTTALVIAMFKWDMAFGMVNKDRPEIMMGPKSYANIRQMVPAICRYYPDQKEMEVLRKIADSLEKLTGTKADINWEEMNTEEIAKVLESTYQVNYHLYEDPRSRVFKKVA